jgi:RNA polymerase sigma-70 factor (ECF subfamily)
MAFTDPSTDSNDPAPPPSATPPELDREIERELDPDVARAAGGDRGAFERVYRAHVNRVYAICVRMNGRRDGADELTQDVFVRVWDKLPQFRGEAAFSTWLHRLAVNVVLEARRGARRHADRYDADANEDDCETVSEIATIASQLDLAWAMARLPPGARAVFALHDIEGYKHEEIASMLGITAGGSKAQLHRARQLLKQTLADDPM